MGHPENVQTLTHEVQSKDDTGCVTVFHNPTIYLKLNHNESLLIKYIISHQFALPLYFLELASLFTLY